MKYKIPEVRIKFAWLLSDTASVVMNEKYGDGTPLRSYAEYDQIAKKYLKWWEPYNDKMLQGISEILDLEFHQNVIDVNVAPWFNPISDPMVIGPAFESQDKLVNTVIHEMIHRLITDNTSIDYDHDFISDWKKLFGDEHDWNTLVHIPVHAVMKKLYLDTLDRVDLFELDINTVKEYEAYSDAWKYVNENDYDKIIDSLTISKSS